MKKLFSVMIVLMVVLSSTALGFAESQEDQKFDIVEDGGLHTTKVVVVKEGVAYSLTEKEYLELVSSEAYDSNPISDVTSKEELESTRIEPRTAIYYKFVPKSITKAYVAAEKKRVSPIYERASSVQVSSKKTYTRKVVTTGGLTVSASVSDAVDAGVQASYSVKKTASSTTSTTVTGTFKPSGSYRYSAVIFTPRIATITGECQIRQVWQGEDTALGRHNMTWKYPCVISGGVLDGIYKLQESNSTSSFTD